MRIGFTSRRKTNSNKFVVRDDDDDNDTNGDLIGTQQMISFLIHDIIHVDMYAAYHMYGSVCGYMRVLSTTLHDNTSLSRLYDHMQLKRHF